MMAHLRHPVDDVVQALPWDDLDSDGPLGADGGTAHRPQREPGHLADKLSLGAHGHQELAGAATQGGGKLVGLGGSLQEVRHKVMVKKGKAVQETQGFRNSGRLCTQTGGCTVEGLGGALAEGGTSEKAKRGQHR